MQKIHQLLRMLAANFLLTANLPFTLSYCENGDQTLVYEIGGSGLLYVTIINNRLLSVDYFNGQRR